MTHYLGIITAYAAVAVLVWLAVLLHPESIPATRDYLPRNRILQLGLFVLATVSVAVLQGLVSHGWLLPKENPLAAALNQLLIFLPLLIYLIAQRTPAAALVPVHGLLRSLAGGIALSLVALAAYISARDIWAGMPELAASVFSPNQADRFVQLLMLDLGLGTLLALLSGGWSRKVAIGGLAVLVLLGHIGAAYSAGLGVGAAGGVLLGSLVAFGLLSAIVYTRNAVWFMPVHAVLGVLLVVGG